MVKRKQAGGVQFSRDPLNLTNVHSRTQDGFLNQKAVGVEPNGDKGVTLTTRKAKKNPNRPAHSMNEIKFGPGASNRKIYKAIAAHTAKNNYRPDLRADALARASAIKYSQKPKKETPEKKPRGAKARKAQEASA
ncbi:MAG: hypothetical protein Q9227_006331 [Pyrenula ochraceoflavens]